MNEPQALLRLQEIDLELVRLNKQLRAMPQQKKLAAIADAQKKLRSNLSKVVGQRKDIEMELEDNEEAQERTRARDEEVRAEALERAQDFRGVRDLEAHLTALAKQLEKLEYKHGELESSLEHLLEVEQKAEQMSERLGTEREAQLASFERDTSELKAHARVLTTERAQVARDVTDEVMARYQTSFKRFGGLAVERLHGNMPTTCRIKLQPGIFQNLMRGPSVTECPYCHRMLVTEGALADE